MSKVENFNSYRKCNEEFCDNDYTHFLKIDFLGLGVYIVLCKEHHKKFINKYLDFEEADRKICVKYLEEINKCLSE